MIDRTQVLVVVAAATFIVPLVFVVLAGVAWSRRSRGLSTGRLGGLLALVGGASLGTMGIIVWDAWLVAAPLYVVAVVVLVERWRRGRRVHAGLFLAGLALPSATLWGFYVALLVTGRSDFEPAATWGGFLGGAAIVGLGAVVVLRGDPAPPPPDPAAPAGRPGSRRIGTIAAAILEPARIGPFRVPDLAAVVAIIVSLTLVAFLPVSNRLLGFTIAIVVAAVAATEAYVRSFPTRSRKSFEAFSWLGEHELERVRRATGEGVPTSKRAAEQWLARHPETPETAWIRSEVLVLAGRSDEALAVAARMPELTVEQRFWRASHLDLAEWARGGPGDPTALEALLNGLGPEGSDERLRGEVAIAASRVRQAMDAGLPPDDAPDLLEPLVRVRDKLGQRADGQVGRALRRRMIPAFLAIGLIFGLVMELLALPLPFGRP